MPNQQKILIVEDEKMLQTNLYMKMESGGYLPTICDDGQQAIDVLKKEQYDLILLDLILPVKDGYSVLEEKQGTMNKETPVIVLTNLQRAESLSRAKQLGARDCFMKSQISLKVVLASVQNVLGFNGPDKPRPEDAPLTQI
jgi:DNA-binding response OmpR family regulator